MLVVLNNRLLLQSEETRLWGGGGWQGGFGHIEILNRSMPRHFSNVDIKIDVTKQTDIGSDIDLPVGQTVSSYYCHLQILSKTNETIRFQKNNRSQYNDLAFQFI